MDTNSFRGRGRPSLGSKTHQVNIRLDDDTIKRLENIASSKEKKQSVNQLVKQITINYLDSLK